MECIRRKSAVTLAQRQQSRLGRLPASKFRRTYVAFTSSAAWDGCCNVCGKGCWLLPRRQRQTCQSASKQVSNKISSQCLTFHLAPQSCVFLRTSKPAGMPWQCLLPIWDVDKSMNFLIVCLTRMATSASFSLESIIPGADRSGPKARPAAAIVKSPVCARTICMFCMWLPLLTSV